MAEICECGGEKSPFDVTKITTKLISVTSGGVKYSAKEWKKKQAEAEAERKAAIAKIINSPSKMAMYIQDVDGNYYEVINGETHKLK